MSGFESQFTRHYAQIAQSVEQGTENPCVRGSIPRLGTIINYSKIDIKSINKKKSGHNFISHLGTNKLIKKLYRSANQCLY